MAQIELMNVTALRNPSSAQSQKNRSPFGKDINLEVSVMKLALLLCCEYTN